MVATSCDHESADSRNVLFGTLVTFTTAVYLLLVTDATMTDADVCLVRPMDTDANAAC